MPNYENNNTYFLSISMGHPLGATQARGEGSAVRVVYEPNEADHGDNNIVWVGIPDGGRIVSASFAIGGTMQLDLYPEIFYAAPGCSLELDEVGSDYSYTDPDTAVETPLVPVPVFLGGENSKIVGMKTFVKDVDASTTVKSGESSNFLHIGFGGDSLGGDRWNNEGGLSQSTGYSLDDAEGRTVYFGTGRELTSSTSEEKEASGAKGTDIENYMLVLDAESVDKDGATPLGGDPVGFPVEKESVLIIRAQYGTNAQRNAKIEQWDEWHTGKAGSGDDEGPPFWSAHEAAIGGSEATGIAQITSTVSASNPGAYAPKGWKGAWATGILYATNDIVSSGLYKYRALTPGGTSGGTDPTGTDASVFDGVVYWECLDGSSGRVFAGGDAVKGYRLGGHRFYAPFNIDGGTRTYPWPIASGQIRGATSKVGHELGIVIVIDRTEV